MLEYETDYWLTCYKEAVEQLNATTSTPINLFVKREAYIAATYANNGVLSVQELRGATDQVQAGDYVLINTRTNEDKSTLSAPVVIEIKRGEATFCIIRQIP